MKKSTLVIAIIGALFTVASLIIWQTTGGDFYTKFEIVRQVAAPTDPDDPLAATGFYDDEARTHTVVTEEFRFGLLPSAIGLTDKHLLSVATVNLAIWLLLAALVSLLGRTSPPQQI